MLRKVLASKALAAFQEELKREKLLFLEKLWEAPKALLIHLALQNKQNILVVTGSKREDLLFEDLSFFDKDKILELPSWETLPGEDIAPSRDIVGKRFQVLEQIKQSKEPFILLATLPAVLQKVVSEKKLFQVLEHWKKSTHISFGTLPALLTNLGYQRRGVVSDKGEFALRGGIIDIYPTASIAPYRIEFMGDEIEEIRTFDIASQKSTGKAESVFICPASEREFLNAHSSSLLEFLPRNLILVLDDTLALEDLSLSFQKMPGAKSSLFLSMEEFLKEGEQLSKIFCSPEPLEEISAHFKGGAKDKFFQEVGFDIFGKHFSGKRFFHPFMKFSDFLSSTAEHLSNSLLENLPAFNCPLLFLNPNKAQEEELQKKLSSLSLTQELFFEQGELSSGFVITDQPLAIFPPSAFTGHFKLRRQQWRSSFSTPPSEFHHLAPGDMVVHFHSGIGKYLGVESMATSSGKKEDFFVIEYAEKSKLYVPLSQAYLINRYIGTHEEAPQMSQLGSKRWEQLKQKAQKQIIGYASDLLHLYAARVSFVKKPLPKDSEEMFFFEQEFPYTETGDQKVAISAIKQDLESEKVMDRLVCGDVGYGKTEVAMRAVFKVAFEGKKQVAILVPTTVLAMQHGDTFKERFENFPLNIEVLSRFHTSKQNASILAKLKEGQVDIVIGTHRLLSKDVVFKDLGLLVIDEEQRFGVRAKEHLKKLKTGLDCLTLSATPIPRTLYMSLVHARDMSVINTPPQDRLPIKTIVAASEDEVIKNALLREFARDGQVFFIHNRVESIYNRAEFLQKLVPQAKIVIVHGQMDSGDIDRIFHRFKIGDANILLATTIIENGIDIPNANTILIDKADTFGLADLYQLRGRVGRWNRTAYAYFLTPKGIKTPEVAQKRLHALLEASGFGGGIKIAMRDLEIRGAGDILGVGQSGQVSSIGFHLYCKLLKQTIDALKDKKPLSFIQCKLELPFDARLPQSYIEDIEVRMELYNRLGEATSAEEIDAIYEELKDRFGPIPEEAIWLYHFSNIRLFATLNHFTSVKLDHGVLLTERLLGDKKLKKVIPIPYKITKPIDLQKEILKKLQESI